MAIKVKSIDEGDSYINLGWKGEVTKSRGWTLISWVVLVDGRIRQTIAYGEGFELCHNELSNEEV